MPAIVDSGTQEPRPRVFAWSEAPFNRKLNSPVVHLDGVAVFENVLFREWTGHLVCPEGTHVLRTGNSSVETITVDIGFPRYYLERTEEVSRNGTLDKDRLLRKTSETRGIFRDPVLPHLWGNYFWQRKQPEAAIRYWKAAILAEPAFAPAHLNLAFALLQKGQKEQAAREFRLAGQLNPLDAFGIRSHLAQFQSDLGDVLPGPVRLQMADYTGLSDLQQDLTTEQRDTLRILTTLRQYVTDEIEQVKMINNIGVYMLQEGYSFAALSQFQSAINRLAGIGSLQEHGALLGHVFRNMARAADAEQMPEAIIYRELSKGDIK
ncbi:MAG: tetratricopeptide repeat protein [Planctomycetaceae bacterium]